MRNDLQRVLIPAFALFLGAAARAQITEIPVPTPGSRPYTIVAGADGNLWFTESNGNKIASITTGGVITEYPVPTAASGPYGIAIGRDGKVWFTERFGNKIGRFDPATHQFREFRILTPFAQPWEIALAPSGSLWFTEEDAGLIGRIYPQGLIREFTPPACCFPTGIIAGPDGRMWWTLEIGDQLGAIDSTNAMTMYTVPNVQVLPWDITPGPDGALWFTELAGRAVGRCTVAGQVTELPVAGAFSGIAGVATGADGNLWFTENDTDHVGAMDTSGNVVHLYNTAAGARPLGIVLGPDGNMWFTEADTNAIGRVAVPSPGVFHVLVLDAGFAPRVRRGRLGQTVQWMFEGPNAHSVTDASGLGLFDSGPHGFVTTYSLATLSAGTFVTRDSAGITPDGAFSIPVQVPASGNAGVAFQVTWSLVAPPPGIVFDVQVREPGAPAFTNLVSGASLNGPYTPAAAGVYQFRARLRDTVSGKTTLFSLPALVNVL